MSGDDEIYDASREVLIDAVHALEVHSASMTLIGAQAVYQRVGQLDLPIPPFTSDVDLAIDPAQLPDRPPIEALLTGAGFRRQDPHQPGIWGVIRRSFDDSREFAITIDLLVPQAVSSGIGRRSARLVGHDDAAARKVIGIEGALVDADVMRIQSHPRHETLRSIALRVAGPAALIVAKVHKIRDRVGRPRSSNKDALDVFRLLRRVNRVDLSARWVRLFDDPRSRDVAESALEILREDFGQLSGHGIRLLRSAVEFLADADLLAESCSVLAKRLVNMIDSARGTPREDASVTPT